MSETNPFEDEKIVAHVADFKDVEAARKDVLQALYGTKDKGPKIAEEYADSVLPILVGNLANKEFSDPSSDKYGQFTLPEYNSLNSINSVNKIGYIPAGSDGILGAFGDQGAIAIYDPTGSYEAFLQRNHDPDLDVANMKRTFDTTLVIPLGSASQETTSDLEKAIALGFVDPPTARHDLLAGYQTDRATVSTPYSGLVQASGDKAVNERDQISVRRSYDVRKLMEGADSAVNLAKIDLPKIADYWAMVNAVVQSASVMLAEDTSQVAPEKSGFYPVGGVTITQAQDGLYGLPVVPQLWRLWQTYQMSAAEDHATWPEWSQMLSSSSKVQKADATLYSNNAWLTWNSSPDPKLEKLAKNSDLDLVSISSALPQMIDYVISGVGENILDQLSNVALSLTMQTEIEDIKLAPIDIPWGNPSIVPVAVTKESGGISGAQTFDYVLKEQVDDIEGLLVQQYFRNLIPLKQTWLADLLKFYARESLFGPLVALLDDPKGGVSALASTHTQAFDNMNSCGYWGFGIGDGLVEKALGSGRPAFILPTTDRIAKGDYQKDSSVGDAPQAMSRGQSVEALYTLGLGTWFAGPTGNRIVGLNGWGTNFVWEVEEAQEKEKVRYFKQILAGLADDILMDERMLRAFGLEKYANTFEGEKSVQGSECYPDLLLPEHPYYGDSKDVFPDFYYWNIYDDGQAFGPEVLASIRESAELVITNCYNSMVRMQSRQDYDPASEGFINEEAGTSEQVIPPLRYNAEGTDGNNQNSVNKGHTGIPYYESKAAKQSMDDFEGVVSTAHDKAQSAAKEVSATSVQALTVNKEEILRANPPTARLSVMEGAFGEGGGVQYPRRASSDVYERLQKHLDSDRKMFGNRAGYLGQHFEDNAPAPEVERLKGTALEAPAEYTHSFDKESLKRLSFDSTRDIISQKMTLRRAFPTFKLFFVEEDEIEDHLISYDDFYSYNGVKEFSVVQSRKLPADTAIITLQNVAGTLDGTKRNAIADMDYFTQAVKKKLPANASTESGDNIAEGTGLEQPFQSVVLRPGMNVQLRAGYANDPRNLHVLISGRVVDITWNKNGDLTEIMVQSFGTELVQAIKGTDNPRGGGTTYYTTHHLLGGLMLEPELAHFGRWEKGQLFQAEESQDARLDFYDYSREGFLGRWKASNSITSAMLKHPTLLLAGAVAVTALNFLPGEGILAKGAATEGSWLARTLGRFTLYGTKAEAASAKVIVNAGKAAMWTGVIEEAAETGLKRGGFSALTAAERKLVVRAAAAKFRDVYKLIKYSKFAGEEVAQLASKEAATALKLLNKASTVEEAAEALAGGGSAMKNLLWTSQWLGKPVPSLLTSPLSYLGASTVKRLGGNLLTAFVTGQSKILLTGILTGAALDGLYQVFKPALTELYDITLGRLQRWFTTSRVTMFLTPQDDNIFCPHPKDYMDMREGTFWDDLVKKAVQTAGTVAMQDDAFGYQAVRWITVDSIFDKRVQPLSAQYQLSATTIWDVFHEMSLRHPGWVYGPRPYGHAFRYTMFFGVPSQRYWAKPASNQFIRRVNELSKFLADNEINEDEYQHLYGSVLDGQPLEDVKAQILREVRLQLGGGVRNTKGQVAWVFDQDAKGPIDRSLGMAPESFAYRQRGTPPPEFFENAPLRKIPAAPILGPLTAEQSMAPIDDPTVLATVQTVLKQRLTVPALKEYLRGLELRFIPFRNHHMISSNRDLIWNGIMNSENAVYNAVSVSYMEDVSDASDPSLIPMKTELFKAHSFIPENMVRILPLPIYRNCKGYPMAIRYGMGTLMDTMKDMYRGEIMVVGNPRLRPWDVAILTDDYNDMVGPIEIEQVVHQFSHETGFITEIKPSAIVIGNEISSWPLIEAAKMWSLAVRDVEAKYWQTGAGGGAVENFMQFVDSQLSEKDREAINDRYDTIFGGDLPFIRDLNSDKELMESLKPWDEGIQDAMKTTRRAGGMLLAGATVAGLLIGGGLLSKVGGGKVLTAFASGGWLAGAAGAGAIGGALMNIPSLQFLLGGTVLFAQCAREESVVIIPLIKNGLPIVSGINIQDPSMMWTHFRGNLIRAVKDTFEGTEDLARLWSEYGSGSWAQIGKAWDDTATLDSKTRVGNANMTGEP
jgi:hypothetical protein